MPALVIFITYKKYTPLLLKGTSKQMINKKSKNIIIPTETMSYNYHMSKNDSQCIIILKNRILNAVEKNEQ